VLDFMVRPVWRRFRFAVNRESTNSGCPNDCVTTVRILLTFMLAFC
jgi:hypothetical protein